MPAVAGRGKDAKVVCYRVALLILSGTMVVASNRGRGGRGEIYTRNWQTVQVGDFHNPNGPCKSLVSRALLKATDCWLSGLMRLCVSSQSQ
jgi:hypothetical protein